MAMRNVFTGLPVWMFFDQMAVCGYYTNRVGLNRFGVSVC